MPLPEFRYINKIGIELEGGWNRRFKDVDIIGDISVQRPSPLNNIPCGCDRVGHTGTCHWGEIPSPPLSPSEGIEWLRAHFPDGVNSTCGFHVHASVKTALQYATLMDKRFFNLFLKRVREFARDEGFKNDHPLWERLREKNTKTGPARFCNRPFAAFEQYQLTSKQDCRRSAINYPYAMHGTVEARIFPAFPEAPVAARAVVVFLSTIEEFLSRTPRPKTSIITLRLKEIDTVKEPFQILKG